VALPTGPVIVAAMLSAGGSLGVRAVTADRTRRRVQEAFGRYVSPTVVNTFVDGEAEVVPGGKLTDVTVMFCDLAGFTAMSTRLEPQALLEVTNRYLGLVAQTVEDHGGYVDKFIGDAVMAVWGAPLPDPDRRAKVIETILAASNAVARERSLDAAKGRPGFRARFGAADGEAIVGNVGTPNRLNYTAIGRIVNMGARMEGLSDFYQTGMIIDDVIADACAEDFVLREIDKVVVKGAAEPVRVTQPIARRGYLDPALEAQLNTYAKALALYRERRFKEAADLWRSQEKLDPPSAVMARRAEHYMETPPPEDWDGAFRMIGKS